MRRAVHVHDSEKQCEYRYLDEGALGRGSQV